MKEEEEKSTSPKSEGNERTQELLGDGLRLCKLASFYQPNHILVSFVFLLRHGVNDDGTSPHTHTRQTNWGIYRQHRETIHITPLERKTATVTCERCVNFSFQGKSPHRHNKPAELCVYIHTYMCIRRENLIEVKAGRDEFFRFLFFIFVWTSSPSSKKR